VVRIREHSDVHAAIFDFTILAVVLAMQCSVPPLTNRVISIIKNTALGSVVALNEILNNAQGASSHSGNPPPVMLATLMYLALLWPVTRWLGQLEQRDARKRAPSRFLHHTDSHSSGVGAHACAFSRGRN